MFGNAKLTFNSLLVHHRALQSISFIIIIITKQVNIFLIYITVHRISIVSMLMLISAREIFKLSTFSL